MTIDGIAVASDRSRRPFRLRVAAGASTIGEVVGVEKMEENDTIRGLTTEPIIPPPSGSWRQRLLQLIGFQRDPFGSGVAELESTEFAEELKRARQQAARAYRDNDATMTPGRHSISFSPIDYFVDPFAPEHSDRLLRQRGHMAIIGEAGSGKTTLRLFAEDKIRNTPTGGVTMAYLPGRESVDLSGIEAHLSCMARALTTDLFIQAIEQNEFTVYPATHEQNEALLRLLQADAAFFYETLNKLASYPEISTVWGMAELWQDLSRHVVRKVHGTRALRKWAADMADGLARYRRQPLAPLRGSQHWRLALDTARLWQFDRVLLMVDSIDANSRRRGVADMEALLQPLLDRLPEFEREGVELKFFLPAELESVVAFLAARGVPTRRLEWNHDGLRQILNRRMLYSGMSLGTLGDLTEPGFSDEIDDQVVLQAKGSPRRLIKVVSEMIAQRAAEFGQAQTKGEPVVRDTPAAPSANTAGHVWIALGTATILFTRSIFNSSWTRVSTI